MIAYIHIPFCHRICPYCSFYKHQPGGTPIPDFIDALVKEMAGIKEKQQIIPRTLYLGGGTPSMLSGRHLEQLFKGLQRWLDFSSLEELTMEANPMTFDLKKAQLFRDLGVTRVSLGVQSLHEPTLNMLGRDHTAQQAKDAFMMLREVGIPFVNVDLMFSVPSLALLNWEETLQEVIAWQPDHISAYNLTYEEDTDFFKQLQLGKLDMNEDRDGEQFFLADQLLTSAGFEHYETSNYAKAGSRSIHNQAYWRGENYVGLGPSAVSTMDYQRMKNVSDTNLYIERVKGVGHALDEIETMTLEQYRIERIALGLRTVEGIELDWLDADGKIKASHFEQEGLGQIKQNSFVLMGRGRSLVDPIAAELI